MLVRDVMSHPPITVAPSATIAECARLLVDKHISGAPVVADGEVLGIVSEGDLMRRHESGTDRRPSWWLELLSDPQSLARDYLKSSGRTVADVMSRQVVSVAEDAPLRAVADILDRRRIKRVPVMKEGVLTGIVSRADLVKALLAAPRPNDTVIASDGDIRTHFLAELGKQAWGARSLVNIIVHDGAVELYGLAATTEQVRALGTLAANTPGVKQVKNEVAVGDHAKYIF